MKPLYAHQSDGLREAHRRLGHRLEDLSIVLKDKPNKDDAKHYWNKWERRRKAAACGTGLLIAWDMGIGKTPWSVRFVNSLPQWGRIWIAKYGLHPSIVKRLRNPKTLIVVPNTIKLGWEHEWREWTKGNEQRELLVIDSTKADFGYALAMILLGGTNQAVISYATLRCRINDGLLKIPWDIVIFDEIQALGNPETGQTQAAYRVSEKALLRIGLSGTPYTNKPDRLWSALVTLQGWTVERKDSEGKIQGYIRRSSIWSSRAEFVRTYCETQSNRWGTKVTGGKNLSYETCELPCCRKDKWGKDDFGKWKRLRTSPRDKCLSLHERLKREVMLRCKTADVVDMPDWTLIDVPVEPTREQRRFYKMLLGGLMTWLEEGRHQGFAISAVIAQMTYAFTTCTDLRQLAMGLAKRTAGDSIVDMAGIRRTMLAGLDEDQFSGKLNWLLDFLENQVNGNGDTAKTLVFTEFKITARILYKTLKRKGYGVVIIDGGVPAKDRLGIEQQFRNDSETTVLIGTSAAYEGINLEKAQYVILFGKVSWVSGKVLQAIKRAHRMTTKHHVTVLRLYFRHTIEVWLNGIIGRKAEDFNQSIDGGKDGGIAQRIGGQFSKSQIFDIFSGNVE